ncbi:unnamed protein product, partial [Tilletia laevis]
MPPVSKTLEELQEEVGAAFTAVGTEPPAIVCLACEVEADPPFNPKHLRQHVASKKHKINAS